MTLDDLNSAACGSAPDFASNPSVAWVRTKSQFREIALAVLDEAFRARVLGQQKAYAKSEPEALINAFM